MTKEEAAANIETATKLIYNLVGSHCSKDGGAVIGELVNNTGRIADALERIADSLEGTKP